jgi:hypothetical protein
MDETHVSAADTCAAIRWVLRYYQGSDTDVIEALLDRAPSDGDMTVAILDAVQHGRLKLDVEAPF